MKNYLTNSTHINWQHPSILNKAAMLTAGLADPLQITKRCFEFVRDDIQHSMDFQRNQTTCTASDVLAQGHGFCYAKSHLLCALLRANHIPTALCYQRLTLADFPEDDAQNTFCLHGLNAVYLPDMMGCHGFLQHTGWYRIDPRGNKQGVNAQFTPPIEKLAFNLKTTGEKDFDQLYTDPLPEVIDVLTTYQDYQEVVNHLPDCC